MNIDFIKWMCEKAEGFEWTEEHVNSPDGCINYYPYFMEDPCYLPLLLQRAIEGVNSCGKWKVSQNHLAIEIYMTGCAFNVEAYEIVSSITPDNAKQSALLYIYEQENP